ncbi:hypothetical protein D3C73_1238080 [compost metagenome]
MPAAFNHLVQFTPVDFAKAIVAAGFIPDQIGIRGAHPQGLQLRHGIVDKLLPQLVVAVTLDLPGHALRAVG